MVPTPNRRQVLATLSSSALLSTAGCIDASKPWGGGSGSTRRIDDWQFDPDDLDGRGGVSGSRSSSSSSGTTGGQTGGGGADGGGGMGSPDGSDAADGASYSSNQAESEDLGLAVGGAQDVNAFRRNVEEGYLPTPESISYEGLFYDYYFDTGGSGGCNDLFCPDYSPAISPDPLADETDHYLTVGLDSSLTQESFSRKQLNLVVVLDISGSMSSSFDDYHYDQYGNRQEVEGETDRPKIDVARDALVTLTEQLEPGDRLGVVLFNQEAHLAKPLRRVELTDMDAIREHIQEDIIADGGTNLDAGIDMANDQLSEYENADPTEWENRTIVLTDAMPNVGDTSAGGLRGTLEDNAEQDLYTSFVGVGIDVNAELVDRITSIRGANYYTVNSADEFEQRMGEHFQYMVTPVVFDVSLELDAEAADIARVYGTTAADETTGEITHIETLFPSPQEGGATRGGVVLVQLTEGSAEEVTLTASWEERDGTEGSTTETVALSDSGPSYDSSGVRKAVLLSRYANLLKNWTIYERDQEAVEEDGGVEVPPEEQLGRWEQQSEDLRVSDPYDDRIETFREHFLAEMDELGDEDLQQEAELMATILADA